MPVTQKYMDQRACICQWATWTSGHAYANDTELHGPVGTHMPVTQSYVDQWTYIRQWHRGIWTSGHAHASDTEAYGAEKMPATQSYMHQQSTKLEKRPTQAWRKPTGTSASHWIKSFPASNALFTQLQISTPEDQVQLHKWQETPCRAIRENPLHFHQIWLKVFFQMSNKMRNKNINKKKKRQVKSHQSKLRC